MKSYFTCAFFLCACLNLLCYVFTNDQLPQKLYKNLNNRFKAGKTLENSLRNTFWEKNIEETESRKIGAINRKVVAKTTTQSLLDAIREKYIAYAPTIFERYSVTYQVTNYRVHCTIWDTSGTPGYDTVRPLAYPETHVFILCFTISDPTTLENIVTKWYPEVRRYCQTTPLILCGCQSDLRTDCETLSKLAEIQRIPVSAEQGVAISRQIGATTYVETSSKTCPKAIQDAFEVSALAALGKLNKSLSSTQKFGSHRYNGTWHRAKVDLNFRDRSKNCVVM